MLAVDRDASPTDPDPTIGVLDDSATVAPPDARRGPRPDRGRQLWLAIWPKLAAVALALLHVADRGVDGVAHGVRAAVAADRVQASSAA